ncbi:hypothetical protein LTR27_009081 [Elasticomyces elasticus]|nr:hypothetical protein LTR27_009081 [Elasticomyces elasticus]
MPPPLCTTTLIHGYLPQAEVLTLFDCAAGHARSIFSFGGPRQLVAISATDKSSPESASYGKHYSSESVADIFAPSADAVATVKAWLHAAGVEADRVSQSVNKQWLQFDAKTSEAEELLKAQYHFYEHGQTGKSSIACDEYHVPAHVKSHVDYITPGIKLYATRAKKSDTAELEKRGWRGPPHRPHPPKRPMPPGMPAPPSMGLQHCDTVATPECIAALYNITKGTKASRGNQLGIFEDLGEYVYL